MIEINFKFRHDEAHGEKMNAEIALLIRFLDPNSLNASHRECKHHTNKSIHSPSQQNVKRGQTHIFFV